MILEKLPTSQTDVPVAVLPTDRPRAAVPAYQAASQSLVVPDDLTAALTALSLQQNVSLLSVMLSGFQVLLYRYTSEPELLLAVVAPDQLGIDLQDQQALYAKLSLIPSLISAQTSFTDLLLQIEQSRRDIQLEKAAGHTNSQADLTNLPLLFSLNTTLGFTQLAGEFKFELCLELSQSTQGLTIKAIYAADLFDAATISRLLDHYLRLLAGACANPAALPQHLPLLGTAEQQQLQAWNNTSQPYPQHSFVQTLFEQQVARTPDAIAVSFADRHVSYAELNSRANQLAHRLIAAGVKPDSLVAICTERSPDMLVALLAAWKAGGAFLPIDPKTPRDRLAFILADSIPIALLVPNHLADLFDNITGTTTVLDIAASQWPYSGATGENPDPHSLGLSAENLAYAIYTSGSTGKPKKAGVIQRGLLNHLPWYISHTELGPGDAMLLVTSYAFDLSQRVIFGPLLSGARLVLATEPFDPQAIVKLVAKQQVTITNLTPSGFHALIDAAKHGELASLQRVYLGGESILVDKLLEMPAPRPAFVNCYGPTECTATATVFSVADLAQYRNRPIPIGKPIANARIYILDQQLQLVPIGVSGEIYIAGVPVGRGYLQQDELTAERFLPDIYSGDVNARMYKTGDLGRWLADGNIEFLGRNDFQIKLRGFRIEQGEIETVLRQHPQLREVVVDVYEPVPGDKRLVAYCIAESAKHPAIADLHQFLKPLLPAYMLPASYVFIDSIPLNRNGKLDRKALPKPSTDSDARDYAPPRNEIETTLVSIWKHVLGVDKIGIRDNFFDMGGYSLLAVSLLQEIKQDFGLELELGRIYHSPTIAELAVDMFSQPHSPWYSLAPIQTQGKLPPLFSIHTISLLDLPQRLGKDQPLYFLRYGMVANAGTESIYLPSVEELAAHYIAEMQQVQPQGPYHLMGFSFGGLIAYEMACQLVANGQQVDFLCLLDTYLTTEKARLPWTSFVRNLLKLSGKEFYSKLQSVLARFKSKKPTTAIPVFDPYVYAPEPDRYASSRYKPGIYPGHVTLIQAEDSKQTLLYSFKDPEVAWRKFLGERLEVQNIPGEHYTIFSEQYIGTLADTLKSCLAQASAKAVNHPL
ncbi:amino acid adenylation domain-containing protein [Methylomonas paludis]|uniref:Amino acid adenylation domain-containing protein n=1 Tax=Methylomonas paludis TaxID=1173101 RepID=A0A975R9R2_9GAMM|nr:non-ribosomal peptide synthetase [Methylomonas paludis]QWF71690.1 amino acid adenylation domain-containing protein [Methylomonas paludis]